MNDERPSQTAAFVATWRALAEYLPKDVRLSLDPLGWKFAPPTLTRFFRPLAMKYPRATGKILLASPLRRLLLWMQLRTRAIDDMAIEFVRNGGRQIVLLGAGYDCRAVRLAPQLLEARIFELDHPATQTRKRAILEAAGVISQAKYIAWNFERDSLEQLSSLLQDYGLNQQLPTLTIWEGVIPYLTARAVESTLNTIRNFGSLEGSQIILHYIERHLIERRTIWHFLASYVGEPLRFGWDPCELADWLRLRGFELVSDRSDEDLARELFAGRWIDTMQDFRGAGGRIARVGCKFVK